MTKQDFIKRVIISSVIAAVAVLIIFGFCIAMFARYSVPNEDNTHVVSGTVTEVYYGVGVDSTIIEMSNGDSLTLVCPWFERELYASIGYDIDELAYLLEGNDIECLRMNELPWAVKIYIDDITINNIKLTEDEIFVARIAIVIIGLIALAFPIIGEFLYINSKYKCYKKAKKKQNRKLKRNSQKAENS